MAQADNSLKLEEQEEWKFLEDLTLFKRFGFELISNREYIAENYILAKFAEEFVFENTSGILNGSKITVSRFKSDSSGGWFGNSIEIEMPESINKIYFSAMKTIGELTQLEKIEELIKTENLLDSIYATILRYHDHVVEHQFMLYQEISDAISQAGVLGFNMDILTYVNLQESFEKSPYLMEKNKEILYTPHKIEIKGSSNIEGELENCLINLFDTIPQAKKSAEKVVDYNLGENGHQRKYLREISNKPIYKQLFSI